jgi:hypothetical protein
MVIEVIFDGCTTHLASRGIHLVTEEITHLDWPEIPLY